MTGEANVPTPWLTLAAMRFCQASVVPLVCHPRAVADLSCRRDLSPVVAEDSCASSARRELSLDEMLPRHSER